MPDHIDTLISDGWIRASRDSPGPTVQYFADLLEARPAEPRIRFAYACALDYSGDEIGAARAYEECPWMELDEHERRTGMIQYASTLRNIGELDAALAVVRQVQSAYPDDAFAVIHGALVLTSQGFASKAVAELGNFILDSGSDSHLKRYEWALRRYLSVL